MADPRRAVGAEELAAVADADARDNYRILLGFRGRLLAAGTLEACYASLFQGTGVDVPPLFVDQLAHVILRNILEPRADPLEARAGELFFRAQKVTLRDGHALLADLETVARHASGARYGSLGRLIVEANGALATAHLDVLDRANAPIYWERESRHDTVISLNFGQAALDALARVIESWVMHFSGLEAKVQPIRTIEERQWAWHIGLDAEASTILNDLWRGEEVEPGRMRRILALLRMDFADSPALRADVAGRPVYLAIAANGEDELHLKPQNLLVNLPLAAPS